MTFHASNFGSFANRIPTDRDGYAHTDMRGWQRAGYSRDEARELAERTRREVPWRSRPRAGVAPRDGTAPQSNQR